MGVDVKNESVAEDGTFIGYGLFAARDFKNGEFICFYKGLMLTKEQIDFKYPGQNTAPYVHAYENNATNNIPPHYYTSNDARERYMIDSASFRSYGAMANHSSNVEKINAAIEPTTAVYEEQQMYMGLFADKPIRCGTEILVDYGADFRFNNVQATANKMLKTKAEIREYLEEQDDEHTLDVFEQQVANQPDGNDGQQAADPQVPQEPQNPQDPQDTNDQDNNDNNDNNNDNDNDNNDDPLISFSFDDIHNSMT